MSFAFDSVTRRRLGYRVIDAIDDYFSSLPDRPVQMPKEQRIFDRPNVPMPEIGADAERVLDDMVREMVDKGFHVPSANYFGLMNPTPTYMSVLAEALVATLNPQLASLARSQLASRIEHETVRWIAERCEYPENFGGTFTTGGNEANFSAIALALAAHFPGCIENGVASIGARPIVYVSAEGHHSVDKSAGLLGIGRNAVHRVPVDQRARIRIDELDRLITRDVAEGYRPFCVIATAGTTNSGAIDDMACLADLCARRNLWLHADAAHGGALVFSDRHRHKLRGIERADSISIDPHKWLAMPFAAGVIITRRKEYLRQAFEIVPPYMPRDSSAALIDNFKISAQWSRRMNALKLWLTLRVHGRQAYEELIDRQLRLAGMIADWARKSPDYDLVIEPDLTIINLRLKDAPDERAAHHAIVEIVNRDGKHWISDTSVAGRSVVRTMVISYLSEESHVASLLNALASAARHCRAKVAAAS